MALKPKVLFLRTQNSCRTQMAEAFLRDIAADEFEIVSAGPEAGRLDPEAVGAMQEIGIDISSAATKAVDPHLGERFHYVITMCNREQERSCPVFPGAIWRLTWPVENPAALSRVGLDHRAAVRHARDSIRGHVREFVEEHHHPKSGKGESAWM
jgi:arsenate reductase